MRKLGVKCNMNTIRLLSLYIVEEKRKGIHSNGLVDEKSGNVQHELVTTPLVQAFCDSCSNLRGTQSGTFQPSPAKIAEFEKDIGRPFGRLKIGFDKRVYYEEDVENADETHFVFEMTDGGTISFKYDG